MSAVEFLGLRIFQFVDSVSSFGIGEFGTLKGPKSNCSL